MEPKQSRSIGLIIRRFFAIFILFSTASGIVAQIETGTFTNETFGSAFVSLLIAYYLARSPRNKTQSSKMDVKSNNDELGDEIQMEELLEEFEESLEEMESEEIQANYKPESVKKSNCLLYTSPSPRDATLSRMPSSA